MTQFAQDENTALVPPVSGRDHIDGSPYAPVVLVEYGDFECPYCGEAYSVIKQLQQRLDDELRFVFRNFPLAQIHLHAEQAAEAVEVAGAQGKYWDMFTMLFTHQRALDRAHLVQYATDLGLDVQQFEQALEDHIFLPRIEEDIESGERSGVEGTPTFFINDLKYSGSFDLAALLEAIEARAQV